MAIAASRSPNGSSNLASLSWRVLAVAGLAVVHLVPGDAALDGHGFGRRGHHHLRGLRPIGAPPSRPGALEERGGPHRLGHGHPRHRRRAAAARAGLPALRRGAGPTWIDSGLERRSQAELAALQVPTGSPPSPGRHLTRARERRRRRGRHRGRGSGDGDRRHPGHLPGVLLPARRRQGLALDVPGHRATRSATSSARPVTMPSRASAATCAAPPSWPASSPSPTTSSCSLLGVPLALPLAVLVFLSGYIPYFGGIVTHGHHPARDPGGAGPGPGHRDAPADGHPHRHPGLLRPAPGVRPHGQHPSGRGARGAAGGLRAGRHHRPVRGRPGDGGRHRGRRCGDRPSSNRSPRRRCPRSFRPGSTGWRSSAGASSSVVALVALLVGILVDRPARGHPHHPGRHPRGDLRAPRRLAHARGASSRGRAAAIAVGRRLPAHRRGAGTGVRLAGRAGR